MKKDTALALAIIAFGIACYVAIGAEWPTPPPGMAYETDLKPHSLVVTNVVLDGVAKTADLNGKRGKTDLMVWEKKHNVSLPDECYPIYVNIRLYTKKDVTWEIYEHDSDVSVACYELYLDGDYIAEFDIQTKALAGLSVDDMQIFFGGRSPEMGKYPILIDAVTHRPTGDQLATTSTVAQVARSVVNTVWDAELGVAWEARMHNGQLYYVAVTNQPPEVK